MRLAQLLAIAVLLTLPAAANPREDPILEFSAPAQLVGSQEFHDLQWAILVFDAQGDSTLDVNLDVLDAKNYTAPAFSRREFFALGNTTTMMTPEAHDLEHGPQFRASLRYDAVGSLVIVADAIDFSMEARAELRQPRPNATMDDYLGRAGYPAEAVRRWAHPVGTGSVVSTLYDVVGKPFEIRAEGVRRMEWFDAEVECSTDCLPGGGRIRLAAVDPFAAEMYSYVALESAGGVLTGRGNLLGAAMGGTSLQVNNTGYVRFASASLTGRCGPRDCPNPDGQAFRANGTVHLGDVHLMDGGDGRMQAIFAADLTAASFDERAIGAFSTKSMGLAAVALAAGLVLVKIAFTLFSRHRRPALEYPRVKGLYDLICAQPGLSFTDLRKQVGTGSGNMRRYLGKLLEEGLIVERGYRNSQRYYENHGRYNTDWQAHAALQDDGNRRLYDWLLARPGSTQTQVRDGAAPDCSRSTLRHALATLRAAGLLRQERQSRYVFYFAVPLNEAEQG